MGSHTSFQKEFIPVACAPYTDCREGGVCPGGCLPMGGVCQGVYPSMHWEGGCLLQCMLGYTPPWTEFLTHACENITFPQLRCGR